MNGPLFVLFTWDVDIYSDVIVYQQQDINHMLHDFCRENCKISRGLRPSSIWAGHSENQSNFNLGSTRFWIYEFYSHLVCTNVLHK